MADVNYPQTTRVLIIGGGFAGLECAMKLAKVPTMEVTLVDKTNHHLFQPLLYQVATATLAAPDIARSLRSILAKADNVKVLVEGIVDLDCDTKVATAESGKEYHFDKLVMAVGGKTSFFGNDHWEKHTIGLKTLKDAYEVRSTVLNNLELAERCEDETEQKKLMTIVIVGGGPTGIELAGAFVELIQRSMKRNFRNVDVSTLRVILVEAGPRVLPPFDEKLSKYVTNRLEKLGVEVMTNSMVTDVQHEKVILGDDTIEAGAILWAAGVQANDITRKLPVEVDRGGRVTPKPDLSLEGYPDIFVAGDICHMKDGDGKPVPGVAPAASQMGRHIAITLINEYRGSSISAREPFVYWDKGSMAIVGRYKAIVEYGHMKLTGFIAWMMWLFIHVLFLVGFRSKLSVMVNWFWCVFTDTPGARVYTPRSKKRCPKEEIEGGAAE